MLKRSHHPFTIKKNYIIQVLHRAEMVASDETGIQFEVVNGYHWVFICYLAIVHEIQISLAKQVVLNMMGKHTPKLWLSDGYAALARPWRTSSNLSCSSGQRYRLWGGGEHRHAAIRLKVWIEKVFHLAHNLKSTMPSTIKTKRRQLDKVLSNILASQPECKKF